MTISFDVFQGDNAQAQRIVSIQEAVGWGKYRAGPKGYIKTLNTRSREDGRQVFVAKKRGIVVGFCEVIRKPAGAWGLKPKEAYVLSIAIDPRHANAGLAQQFGRWVLDALGEQGFHAAVADVAFTNRASLNLNTALGGRFLGASPQAVQELAQEAHVRIEHPLSA